MFEAGGAGAQVEGSRSPNAVVEVNLVAGVMVDEG